MIYELSIHDDGGEADGFELKNDAGGPQGKFHFDESLEFPLDDTSVGKNTEEVVVEADGELSQQAKSNKDDSVSTREHSIRVPYIEFELELPSDLESSSPKEIGADLLRIVEVEQPVICKRAYQIYLRKTGKQKLTRIRKRTLNRALREILECGAVLLEHETDQDGYLHAVLRTNNSLAVKLRTRGPRRIEEIPPSEISLAARILSNINSFEPKSEELIREV